MNQSKWLSGLRRIHTQGCLSRLVSESRVTGALWTPQGTVVSDWGASLEKLSAAGASADARLFRDLMVTDVRAAADLLWPVFVDSEGWDGYVAVWLDPASLTDPGRAVGAARELVNDIDRANLAVAFVWTGSRSGAVSALVGAGISIALAGSSLEAVSGARRKGLERLNRESDQSELPVFLLDSSSSEAGIVNVVLASDRALALGESDSYAYPLSADQETQAFAGALNRMRVQSLRPAHEDTYHSKNFPGGVRSTLTELESDSILERIWRRDHTVWRPDPSEIIDRLGWLTVASAMKASSAELHEFARAVRSQAVNRVVLMGMGGSSLAPAMFSKLLPTGLPLTVLDTTEPATIVNLVDRLDLERTFFIVSSKSGTTVETRCQLEFFWERVSRPQLFAAVTDPGTPLAKLATERGFLRCFENAPDIGGRYSALSYFGLVPAAACSIDFGKILDQALQAVEENEFCVPPVLAPGVRLGAAIAEAATSFGADKLTLFIPGSLEPLGDWIEQLIAESLGKQGRGVLPVIEDPGPREAYGNDRFFVAYSVGDDDWPKSLNDIEEDHPVVRLRLRELSLGAEIFRWEMATAVAAHILDIHPFDQPDVESAKQATRAILESGSVSEPPLGSAEELLNGLVPGEYVALQAFLPQTDGNNQRLRSLQTKIRDRHQVAVTVGFGPRFLHSTGQFHKGGPATGVFLQLTQPAGVDVAIPNESYSFGQLFSAQADGDLRALDGRRIARTTLPDLERLF